MCWTGFIPRATRLRCSGRWTRPGSAAGRSLLRGGTGVPREEGQAPSLGGYRGLSRIRARTVPRGVQRLLARKDRLCTTTETESGKLSTRHTGVTREKGHTPSVGWPLLLALALPQLRLSQQVSAGVAHSASHCLGLAPRRIIDILRLGPAGYQALALP